MTNPNEPTWQLDADGARLYSMDDLSDCWNLRDLEMDRVALTDYLNALETKLARAEERLQVAVDALLVVKQTYEADEYELIRIIKATVEAALEASSK